jgi:hypothetical protein
MVRCVLQIKVNIGHSLRSPEQLVAPIADYPVAQEHAPLQQHLLKNTKTQRKTEVQLHMVTDDLNWEAVALVQSGSSTPG